jgi:hypothetical protein
LIAVAVSSIDPVNSMILPADIMEKTVDAEEEEHDDGGREVVISGSIITTSLWSSS